MGKKENNVMIGLEIHGYLETEEKLFCSCKNFHDMRCFFIVYNLCEQPPVFHPIFSIFTAHFRRKNKNCKIIFNSLMMPREPLFYIRKERLWLLPEQGQGRPGCSPIVSLI